jgi:hypothetical protein
MFTIKMIAEGMRTLTVEASTVIIEDEYGNPVSVAVAVNGAKTISTIEDGPTFHKILQSLGIDKTVIVDKLDIGPAQGERLRL